MYDLVQCSYHANDEASDVPGHTLVQPRYPYLGRATGG
jgi:hypothetical protein